MSLAAAHGHRICVMVDPFASFAHVAFAAMVPDVTLRMCRQVAHACMELSKAYLAAHQGEQAGKHLNRAVTILTLSARGNTLSKVPSSPLLHLLGVASSALALPGRTPQQISASDAWLKGGATGSSISKH